MVARITTGAFAGAEVLDIDVQVQTGSGLPSLRSVWPKQRGHLRPLQDCPLPMSAMPPKAYSYLRFSRPEQLKGDSRRRQLDLSRQYALEHGLDLDQEFQDLGVSALRGAKGGGVARRGRLS